MHLLWFLAHRSLGKDIHGTYLKDCNYPGELAAPQIFLNVSEAQEGDTVAVRCMPPSNLSVTIYFFCKDGKYLSASAPLPHDVAYTWVFQISKQSAGQYSCRYKCKDNNNRETKSVISVPWKLTVLSGNHPKSNTNSISTGLRWILPVVLFAILILGALFYFSEKKVLSQRSSREKTPVKKTSSLTSVESVQYASIVRFNNSVSPPFQNAETQYATIVLPKQMSGLSCEPASEPSNM